MKINLLQWMFIETCNTVREIKILLHHSTFLFKLSLSQNVWYSVLSPRFSNNTTIQGSPILPNIKDVKMIRLNLLFIKNLFINNYYSELLPLHIMIPPSTWDNDGGMSSLKTEHILIFTCGSSCFISTSPNGFSRKMVPFFDPHTTFKNLYRDHLHL